ncbi:hypothetical protein ABID22_004096 [Pontibacter aydingkolensis]|uniref:Uncharacterized protein n=1 Tax=Pontibacter aydingkolensis TaxID=1911536 RepID=A0ABS7CZR6_9BACT|nr:hypothetical protein [Pontibacter aydingkolensis]MBW7469316.1 hypothetical protein [Pontibacter aydingkolensis]
MFSPDLPAPILFHPFKHHLGFILAYIKANQSIDLIQFRADLLTLGTSQLDLYFGPLDAVQIADETVLYLQQHDLLTPAAFRHYLGSGGQDYRCITLSDTTDWVLRWGTVNDRYVHLHPARYASHTTRVKAAALKTAIATVIASAQLGLPASEISTINKVRTEWLGLSPVKWVNKPEGIGKFLKLLQDQL